MMFDFRTKSPAKRIVCAQSSKCRGLNSYAQRAFKIGELTFAHLKRIAG